MERVLPSDRGPHYSRLQATAKFLVGELYRRPRVVYQEVTLRCNARCDFCDYWRHRERDELRDYRSIVRRFDPVAVVLTGGEPLLRADIVDVVAGIKETGNVFVSLVTNGSLLDLDKARRLRAAGLDGLNVSLNYLGERQDEERGVRGLYRRLERLIPELPSVGFSKLNLNTVLLDSNLEEVPRILEQAHAWGVGISLSYYSITKNGNHEHELAPTRAAALRRVVGEVLAAKRRGWEVESSEWYLEHILAFHARGSLPDCPAGRRTIHVTPSGYVRPCPDLPVVGHWSTYDPARARPVACGACWYACRGEAQAPLTPARLLGLARFRARSHGGNGGR